MPDSSCTKILPLILELDFFFGGGGMMINFSTSDQLQHEHENKLEMEPLQNND